MTLHSSNNAENSLRSQALTPAAGLVDKRQWLSRRQLLRSGMAAVAMPFARWAYCDDQAGGIRAEIERVLWEEIFGAWYPRCLDRQNGGFHEEFSEDWTRLPSKTKFLVYQARMTWTPAAILLVYPDRRDQLSPLVDHGMRFLRDRMWDAKHGGFADRTDLTGKPDRRLMPWKQLYAYSFGIYAAATAYRATRDRQSLKLAQDAFAWLDEHAHDPRYGGYYEQLAADGHPVSRDIPQDTMGQGLPVIGHVGHKSMNAHIHLLEALIALRRVWDDSTLTARLEETFRIVRDKIVRPPGHLAMFCDRQFRPVDERNSFGHQLEIAYLLMEACGLLGNLDLVRTQHTAQRLVDHSLHWGWDQQHDGFFDEGPPAGKPTRTNKVWWVQPEGMNGLLTVGRFAERENASYQDYFRRTWRFLCDRLIDHRRGGCYGAVTPAGELLPDNRRKATPWKTAYHVTRAMLLAIESLGH